MFGVAVSGVAVSGVAAVVGAVTRVAGGEIFGGVIVITVVLNTVDATAIVVGIGVTPMMVVLVDTTEVGVVVVGGVPVISGARELLPDRLLLSLEHPTKARAAAAANTSVWCACRGERP